jgi:hypothetical protein
LKEVPEKGYTLMKLLNETTAGFNNTCISTFNIGRIVDHHCLEGIVCFVNIGRIVDHHNSKFSFLVFFFYFNIHMYIDYLQIGQRL